jgi:hypothetical protein
MKLKRALTPVLVSLLILSACSTPEAGSNSNNRVGIGSNVRLRGGSSSTVVAVSFDALDEFEKAQAAKDKYGIEQMGQAGKVFLIPNMTRAVVIDSQSVGAYKIRILEGDHVNEAVWTDEAWMTPEGGGAAR